MTGIVTTQVFHARLRPKPNKFCYRATYLSIPLNEMVPQRRGLFSVDQRNLFSVRSRDYGEGPCPQEWIAHVLDTWGVPHADGTIELITMPRILGYAFNPVNFWLCRDRDGGLRAVLAEVNNTFGERHCYFCFHDDRRPIISSDVLTARKVFHVSPFMETKGDYSFRFSSQAGRLAIAIDLADEAGPLLKTTLAGNVQPLTNWALLQSLLMNPLMPLKVIGLIHYQAVKLFLKRVHHVHKPEPPAALVSH